MKISIKLNENNLELSIQELFNKLELYNKLTDIRFIVLLKGWLPMIKKINVYSSYNIGYVTITFSNNEELEIKDYSFANILTHLINSKNTDI